MLYHQPKFRCGATVVCVGVPAQGQLSSDNGASLKGSGGPCVSRATHGVRGWGLPVTRELDGGTASPMVAERVGVVSA
jgi:hypothetical protein